MNLRNLQIYRLPCNYSLTAEALIEAITAQAFAPCTSHQAMSQGWVPPRENGPLVHVVNGQMILRLQTQTKVLPGAVINAEVKKRAAVMEKAQNFAPGKKALKELKENVTDELMAKAFPKDSQTWVWIDRKNGWLVVDAASASKADDVIKLLLKAVDRMPLESLRVQRSPVAAMTDWLNTDEAPAGFTLDTDATLRATGESKASITYKRHTLETDEMQRHIAAGKQCVRLAMTWESKISFVLTESLAIKSVKLLDVMTESDVSPRNEDERFDNNAMLITGELAKLMAELVEELGGFAAVDATTDTASAAPAPADGVQDVVRKLHQIAAQGGATMSLTVNGMPVVSGGAVSAMPLSGNRAPLAPTSNANQKAA
jgi:DNA recombination-dependent growth factor C